eukprot:Transcript_23444.p2 GENE.Transcript_23444~~Transcript_23444.p2  ORF type:complete len:443 (+),score=129.46 Transcript_23444:501-1829(+)
MYSRVAIPARVEPTPPRACTTAESPARHRIEQLHLLAQFVPGEQRLGDEQPHRRRVQRRERAAPVDGLRMPRLPVYRRLLERRPRIVRVRVLTLVGSITISVRVVQPAPWRRAPRPLGGRPAARIQSARRVGRSRRGHRHEQRAAPDAASALNAGGGPPAKRARRAAPGRGLDDADGDRDAPDKGEHAHAHDARPALEQAAVDREARHAEAVDRGGAFAALHAATVRLLVAKALLARDELRQQVELLDAMAYGQTMEGAALVAKAWEDPSFRATLLADPAAAIEQAGLSAVVHARGGVGSTRAGIATLEYMGSAERGAPPQAVAPVGDTALVVVENTATVHNLVVCTLCSCYPRALLGLPPRYYTSRAYRARCVSEPRAVLAEFGCALPPTNTTVRVHDSTADTRVLVLPQRPAGTDGWSEEALKSLATRDCLVGVALPRCA